MKEKNVSAKKAFLGRIFFLGLDIFVKLSTDMQDTNMYIDKNSAFILFKLFLVILLSSRELMLS
jgi:hypothetical protein